MTTNKTPASATTVSHLKGAPEGIVRLFVPDGLDVSKLALRNLAAKAAGTIHVGRTPAGKPANLNGTRGHQFDFSPVARRAAGEAASESVAEATDPRVAALAALGLSPEQITAALAAAPAEVKSSGKAKAKGKAKGKSSGFHAEVIVKRGKARAAGVAKCSRCLGFGFERSHPREDAKYPYAFRTAAGAAKAPTGRTCTACKGVSRTA